MSDQILKAHALRALHAPGTPLVLFNCWDAGSAKAIAAAGARAIATASWAVAAANGYDDGEQIPRDLAIANIERIARAVTVPVTADLERGYGATPGEVADTVAQAIRAGAVGCNLEDGIAAGGLRDPHEQALRLQAARDAADKLDVPLFINARTDGFLLAAPGDHDDALLDATLARARVYAAHGADCLFVPGLVDAALIGRLVQASPLPVNLMAAAGTPPLATLRALGVARLSHGPGPYLQTMRALEDAARGALA
ncbi:2-Methylisocitrate lyase, PEP mutase family [Massilia sp. PDC64]|nr:isocitrate lyase/phosphoenolpyruvate mutase family protein [Massilia sp. PDC64]SDC27568.1 2-Methylisocitrate lyase, PEP mutase family [Massilia sp. PDC64]